MKIEICASVVFGWLRSISDTLTKLQKLQSVVQMSVTHVISMESFDPPHTIIIRILCCDPLVMLLCAVLILFSCIFANCPFLQFQPGLWKDQKFGIDLQSFPTFCWQSLPIKYMTSKHRTGDIENSIRQRFGWEFPKRPNQMLLYIYIYIYFGLSNPGNSKIMHCGILFNVALFWYDMLLMSFLTNHCPLLYNRSSVPGPGAPLINRRVRTLYACEAENESELSFGPNEIIYNGRYW